MVALLRQFDSIKPPNTLETKRTLAFITFTAAILATAPLPASAAQIVAQLHDPRRRIAVHRLFLSSPVDLFQPSDETILAVSVSASGALTFQGDQNGEAP